MSIDQRNSYSVAYLLDAERSRSTLDKARNKAKARKENIRLHNERNQRKREKARKDREQQSKTVTVHNRPKYRPGMNSEFYRTKEWMIVRYDAIKRLGLKCACCGAEDKEVIFHVDHIKPRSLFPLLELVPDNLQILCEACNIGKGNRDSINWHNVRAQTGPTFPAHPKPRV